MADIPTQNWGGLGSPDSEQGSCEDSYRPRSIFGRRHRRTRLIVLKKSRATQSNECLNLDAYPASALKTARVIPSDAQPQAEATQITANQSIMDLQTDYAP